MQKNKPGSGRYVKRDDWENESGSWKGQVSGDMLDSDVTILFFATNEVDSGPTWHVHPYDEVFIIQTGCALFTIGDQKIEATAGDVLLGPATVPHKYKNLGPGRLQSIDIHLSHEWIQTDLDDPEEC